MLYKNLAMQKNLATHKIASHFIFNVLAALKNLVAKKETDKSIFYIERFSELFSPLVDNEGKLFRPLKAEIDFITNYLELEKLRFTNRFTYQINVAPSVDENIYVPAMVIHSFVNNAVKYGIEFLERDGKISVNFFQEGHFLSVEITDNGKGFDEIAAIQKASIDGKREGKGIKTVQDIFAFLNKQHPIPSNIQEIRSSSNGTTVVLSIYTKYPPKL